MLPASAPDMKRWLVMLRVEAISDCVFTWAPGPNTMPFWLIRMIWPPAEPGVAPSLRTRPWMTLGFAS